MSFLSICSLILQIIHMENLQLSIMSLYAVILQCPDNAPVHKHGSYQGESGGKKKNFGDLHRALTPTSVKTFLLDEMECWLDVGI